MAARWRSPPDSSPGGGRKAVSQSDPLEHGRRLFFSIGLAHPPDQQGHGHVLSSGKLGQEMVKLVDESGMRLRRSPRAFSDRAYRSCPPSSTRPVDGVSSP